MANQKDPPGPLLPDRANRADSHTLIEPRVSHSRRKLGPASASHPASYSRRGPSKLRRCSLSSRWLRHPVLPVPSTPGPTLVPWSQCLSSLACLRRVASWSTTLFYPPPPEGSPASASVPHTSLHSTHSTAAFLRAPKLTQSAVSLPVCALPTQPVSRGGEGRGQKAAGVS